MTYLKEILMILGGFGVVSLASFQLAKLFQKIKLPLITGFLIAGVIAGPFALLFVQNTSIPKLTFINDISLAFIAFAAGSELYLKDLRGRLKSIALNSLIQVIVAFGLGALAVYFLADYIPFMASMNSASKWAVAMLAGTIFVASSPASAIAIINELRAKGPFTQSALGVTVVKDIMVVILFSIVFSISQTTFSGEGGLSWLLIVDLTLEIGLALGIGYVLGKLLALVLGTKIPNFIKTVITLGAGYCIYLFSHFFAEFTHHQLPFTLHLEPLLINIIAGFYVTNYSNCRKVFHEILEMSGPIIYVVFFTLTGASMALDVLIEIWLIALVLFIVRILALVMAGFVGGAMAKDPKEFRKLNWMPFVTQAGVGLGLAVIVEETFPDWGKQFATVIIGVIVLNQAFGPPFFKWAIQKLGEDHSRKQTPAFDGVRDAILFGADYQSFALARQLMRHGWIVRIVTCIEKYDQENKTGDEDDLEIIYIPELTPEALTTLDTFQAEAIVCLMDDEQNFKMCELAFEHLGTKDLIVVLRDPANWKRFKELGVLVVEPSTAMVNLLDHMVRSPQATQLLLGMDENQDSLEVEVLDTDLVGMLLRDLRLPKDVIILSVRRGDQVIIPHGYTRLRLHDYISLVGTVESLDTVALKLGI